MASDNIIHDVWQTAERGNILTSSAGGEVDIAIQYQISQIAGIASWLAVFDQYRIVEIESWLTPSSSTQINVDNFRWLSVVDYDDTTTPSFNALLQYSNVTDSGRTEGVYRRFRPHVLISQVQTGGPNQSKNELFSWTDSAFSTVLAFGIKVSMTATSTSVVMAERVRFHLQFRNNI
jgi:hypothetical protein